MGNTVSWGTALFYDEGREQPIVKDDGTNEIDVKFYRLPRSHIGKYYMCKHMKRTNSCLYGETCKFAHSKSELWIPKSEFFKRKRIKINPL